MSRAPGSASLSKIKRNTEVFKKNNYVNSNSLTSAERTLKSKHNIKAAEDLLNSGNSEYLGDLEGYEGLFTTQQLVNVDFSKFENHVFFDSAVSKVKYAYQKILNEFPYDKSEYDFKQYMNGLDGYTRYVFDNYIPKSTNYLKFDGVNEVFIKDTSGHLLNDYVGEVKTGLVDINKNKFSFEFWIYVLDQDIASFGQQVLFQKKHNSEGITFYLDSLREENSKKFCKINMLIVLGDEFHLCKGEIEVGKFCHVNFSTITLKGKRKTTFYKDGKIANSESHGMLSKNTKFSNDFLKSDIRIGNGLSHVVSLDNQFNVSRTSGLKGYIDDFRFFTSTRQQEDITEEKNYTIHARKSLNLYYKFNEPAGNYLNNQVVLDSSGNKLHGIIRNTDGSAYTQQEISSFKQKDNNVSVPIKYEILDLSPVLFPNYEDTLKDQQRILRQASEYDKSNPNVVWKLFPKYLFVEGSDRDGFDHIFISKENLTVGQGNNLELFGTKKTGSSLVLNVILIWARFFDQLKSYIDNISNILNNSYDNLNEKKQASIILPIALKQIGLDFEEIFPDAPSKKLSGQNLTHEEITSQKSIRQIQNVLWKRFLINSQDYVRSKGTKNSIKSIFNSFGLDPDTFISIREFNSQNKLNISEGFVEKHKSLSLIDFNRKEVSNLTTTFANGKPENKILFECDLFKNNQQAVQFQNNWSIELCVRYDIQNLQSFSNNQSIIRLDHDLNNTNTPYINLVFKRDKKTSKKGTLLLYVNEVNQNSAVLVTQINSVELFDGRLHYICISKNNKTARQSDYTLTTSLLAFGSKNIPTKKILGSVNIKNKNVTFDNSVLRIGESSLYTQQTIDSLPNYSFESIFEGRLGLVKVWSKTLDDKEIKIHKTDMFNIGTNSSSIITAHQNLLVNADLTENFSSFSSRINNEKLVLFNNILNTTDNTEIRINLPQSYLNITEKVFSTENKIFLEQSRKIDYPENYNRVNINSLDNKSLMSDYENYNVNPSFDTEGNFSLGKEDIKLSIDFSVSNFVDSEISKILLVNDFYTRNLGNASSLFEPEYQSLYELRNVFYDKLEKEINIDLLYQVYKFYDNALETLLNDAVSSKAHYQGFNFVYESSIAERPKYEYKMSDSRIGLIEASKYISFDTYNDRYYTPFNAQEFARRDAVIDSDKSFIVRTKV